jgi:ABC-type sugar transport system substrate-binding protein
MTNLRVRLGVAVFAVLVVAVALTACGGGSSSSSSSSGGEGSSGTDSSASKEVIAFTPTNENPHVAKYNKVLEESFAEEGYKLKVFNNNFEQHEEDQQVEQVLATGSNPSGFIYWPSDNEASIASVRKLSKVAPVVQVNSKVLPDAEPYVVAYSGVGDTASGETTGKMAMEMRKVFEEKGLKPASPGGNAMIVTIGGGFAAGIDRVAGFEAATESEPFNIVETVESGSTPEEAYKAVSQVLPRLKSEKPEYIIAIDDELAAGAIEALKEAGYTPGTDVGVVSGACSEGGTDFESGALYATILQPPEFEATVTVQTMVGVLNNNGEAGSTPEYTPPLTADTEPKLPQPPAQRNYIPLKPLVGGNTNPAQNKEIFEKTLVWGIPANELCA